MGGSSAGRSVEADGAGPSPRDERACMHTCRPHAVTHARGCIQVGGILIGASSAPGLVGCVGLVCGWVHLNISPDSRHRPVMHVNKLLSQ